MNRHFGLAVGVIALAVLTAAPAAAQPCGIGGAQASPGPPGASREDLQDAVELLEVQIEARKPLVKALAEAVKLSEQKLALTREFYQKGGGSPVDLFNDQLTHTRFVTEH